jgi:hypothetical protein
VPDLEQTAPNPPASTSTSQECTQPKHFEPPPYFDLVKELNGHAGRLASLLAFVVAVLVFSTANGPIHDQIAANALGTETLVVLLITAVLIFLGAASVGIAMHPPVAYDRNNEQEWARLVTRKQGQTTVAALSVLGALFGAVTAEVSAYGQTDSRWYLVSIVLLGFLGAFILVLLIIMAVSLRD